MKDTFTNRLNKAMAIRDMKQVDLAEKTGISKSRINHYVNGLYDAKQDAVYLIAKALNVREAWLMGYDVEMERHIQFTTIAAHHDGEDWTEEELEDIEIFKEALRLRREKKAGKNDKRRKDDKNN